MFFLFRFIDLQNACDRVLCRFDNGGVRISKFIARECKVWIKLLRSKNNKGTDVVTVR